MGTRALSIIILAMVFQLAAPARAETGISVGLALSRIHCSNPIYGYSQWESGPQVGLYHIQGLREGVELQAGFYYVQRGGSFEDKCCGPTGEQSVVKHLGYELDYLDFPVGFRLKPPSAPSWVPEVLAGISIGYVLKWDLIDQDVVFSGYGDDQFDWALQGGLSRKLGFIGDSTSVDVVYRHSMGSLGSGWNVDFFRSDSLSLLLNVGF